MEPIGGLWHHRDSLPGVVSDETLPVWLALKKGDQEPSKVGAWPGDGERAGREGRPRGEERGGDE